MQEQNWKVSGVESWSFGMKCLTSVAKICGVGLSGCVLESMVLQPHNKTALLQLLPPHCAADNASHKTQRLEGLERKEEASPGGGRSGDWSLLRRRRDADPDSKTRQRRPIDKSSDPKQRPDEISFLVTLFIQPQLFLADLPIIGGYLV